MNVHKWLAVLVGVWLLLLSACGGRTIGDVELADERDSAQSGSISPFRELYQFPGNISGFVPVNGRYILSSQEVCLNIEQGVLDQTQESPLVVTFANERLTFDAFVLEVDDELGIDSYCFNPIVGEGVYTIDIELIIDNNTELYTFNFNSNLPDPFRLLQYPNEFVGLTLITSEERQTLPDTLPPSVRFRIDSNDMLCIPVAEGDVVGGEIVDNVSISLNGRLLDTSQLTYSFDGSFGEFCLNNTPDIGVYDLYILVNVVASVPPTRLAFQGEFIVLETE